MYKTNKSNETIIMKRKESHKYNTLLCGDELANV